MNTKPVAWINEYDGLEPFNPDNRQDWIPLYTHPAKTLTDEEILREAYYILMREQQKKAQEK
jgi:hypothetical protein